MLPKLAPRQVALALGLLPFICLPVVSLAVWHHFDTLIPNDDAGQYAQTAAEIYRPLSDGKPLKFIKNLYLKRGYRPVTLPCFAALCLPPSGGDLKSATALTLCLFYALLYGYSFQLLRLFTTTSAAAIGACLATTLPWILQYSAAFYADVPMVAATVAALYHAQRCDNWTSLPHCAALGVALALAITLRPVEPLPAVATLLLLLLVSGCRSQRLAWRDFRLALIPLVALLIMLLLCVFEILRSKVLVAALFCPAIVIYVREVKRAEASLNCCFAATVATLLGGLGMWYVPAAAETWRWIWSCSFGELNRLYKGVGKLDFADALYVIFTNLGGVQLAIVAGLAALALVMRAGTSWIAMTPAGGPNNFPSVQPMTRPRPAAATSGALILVCGLVQVVLVIAMAALTPGTDLRRGFVGFYWTFLGLMIYAASPAFKWYQLRMVGLGAGDGPVGDRVLLRMRARAR